MKKSFYNRILFSILCSMASMTFAVESSLSFADIGNLSLQHDAAACIPQPKAIIATQENVAPQAPPIASSQQQHFEAAKTWFSLLHSTTPERIPANMNLDSLKKLSILSDEHNTSSSLLDSIPTQTLFGKAYTAEQLVKKPSLEHIKNMQKITQQLSQTVDTKKLTDILGQIHKNHIDALALLATPTSSFQKNSIFAAQDVSPASVAAKWYLPMLTFNRLRIIAEDLGIDQFCDIITKIFPDIRFIRKMFEYLNDMRPVDIYLESTVFPKTPNAYTKHTMLKQKITHDYRARTLEIAMNILKMTYYSLTAYSLDHAKYQEQKAVFNNKYQQVTSMQMILKQLSDIHNLTHTITSQQHPELATTLKPLKQLFSSSPDLHRLLTQNFSPPSLFSPERELDVEVAYAVLYKHRSKIIPALKIVGALDTHFAAAKLVTPQLPNTAQDHSNTAQKFCIVELIDQEKPLIQLRQCWNPLLKTSTPVKNDISLGTPHNTMVITGPNGTGKTAAMKTVALNAVLTNLGIAAAESAQMTPMTSIQTYLGIKDDLSKNVSTFMNETLTLDNMATSIKKSPPTEKILSIIDEPIKGTIERTGGKIVTEKMKTLMRPNHLIMVATHFEQPTTLAEQRPEQVVNTYLSTQQTSPTTFKRNYTLLKGKCSWWFDNAERRDAFTDWLAQQ